MLAREIYMQIRFISEVWANYVRGHKADLLVTDEVQLDEGACINGIESDNLAVITNQSTRNP